MLATPVDESEQPDDLSRLAAKVMQSASSKQDISLNRGSRYARIAMVKHG